MSQQDLNEKECEFKSLVEKMKEAEKKKQEYEDLYKDAKKEYRKICEKVQSLCNHVWEVDRNCYDHRNHYDCLKCGAYK